MGWLRQLFSRRRRYDELSETIREHLDEKIADLMDRGMAREEAERTARREFGNVTLIEERSREVWQNLFWESLLADAKFALRQLSKSRGPAVIAILSLAIGIGATTAIFSVVYGVILRSLPYFGADRIVHLNVFDHSGDRGYAALSGAQFSQLKNIKSLDGAIVEDNWTMAITNEDLPQAVQVDQVSGNAIDFFGVQPLFGRAFGNADDPIGQEPNHVAILGFKFWKNHFGGRPDVIGKILQLDHQNYTVIGVMPREFLWGSVDAYAGSDIYLPLKLANDQSLMYPITARLKTGISRDTANAELQAIYKQFAKETPDRFPPDFVIRTIGVKESAISSIQGTLWVLFGSVAALLAIGCINVGILLLARGVQRRAEFAIRGALGAQRVRLIRQLLTESLVISITGGIVGIPFSFAGTALLTKWLPQGMLPMEAPTAVDLPVLMFSIVVALITGISCGLRPALEFSRPVVSQMLVSSARSTAGNTASKRIHGTLIISQVAFSVLLLAAALAALQTLVRLYRTPLGYDPVHVLTVGLPIVEGGYPGWSQRIHYYTQIRRALADAPGVVSAAITTQVLPPVSQYISNFTIIGQSNSAEQTTTLEQVSGEYFSTLHIPLLQGRIWSGAEDIHAGHVAVINQSMARRYWPNGNAIGQMIKMPRACFINRFGLKLETSV
jgi:predicted permease